MRLFCAAAGVQPARAKPDPCVAKTLQNLWLEHAPPERIWATFHKAMLKPKPGSSTGGGGGGGGGGGDGGSPVNSTWLPPATPTTPTTPATPLELVAAVVPPAAHLGGGLFGGLPGVDNDALGDDCGIPDVDVSGWWDGDTTGGDGVLTAEELALVQELGLDASDALMIAPLDVLMTAPADAVVAAATPDAVVAAATPDAVAAAATPDAVMPAQADAAVVAAPTSDALMTAPADIGNRSGLVPALVTRLRQALNMSMRLKGAVCFIGHDNYYQRDVNLTAFADAMSWAAGLRSNGGSSLAAKGVFEMFVPRGDADFVAVLTQVMMSSVSARHPASGVLEWFHTSTLDVSKLRAHMLSLISL